MHVVSPARYQPKKSVRKRRGWLYIPIILVLCAGMFNFLRPLPSAQATMAVRLAASNDAIKLEWPGQGQAAVAANGYGLLATYGDQKPIATASITKVILALCVLQKLPIQPGSEGKSFTIGQDDVDLYDYYIANQGSRVPVVLGEQLTEYQAIQALMLPSANNIADSLVGWVFGGHDQYVAYATEYLQQNGMYATTIGTDASGYDPSTASTASDLTKLGLLALSNPLLMNIAGQSESAFPVAGTVTNYNTVLGQNGITGLKTGNNDANPGAFLFTATAHYGNQSVQITGAILGADDLQSALDASVALVGSIEQNFELASPLPAQATVGTMHTPWGAKSPIITTEPVQLVRWKGTALKETHVVEPNTGSGNVGKLQLRAGQASAATDLRLANPIPGPSFWWRVTRL